MKHLFIISAAVASMLLTLSSTAQEPRIDTVATLDPGENTDWSKMTALREGWFPCIKKEDFFLFIKYPLPKPGQLAGNVSHYGNATLWSINDMRSIELAATGINASNASDFTYHVVVNDSAEMVPWSTPDSFRITKNITYAYLGSFDVRDKVLTLEVYNKKNYKDRSKIIFNSSFNRPANVESVILYYNDKYLFNPHKQHYISDKHQKHFFIKDSNSAPITFNWSDSINHLVIEMENGAVNHMYNAYMVRYVEGKTDTAYISNNWEVSHYSPNALLRVNGSFFNKPGNYKLVIVPEAPEGFQKNNYSSAVIIPFTVLPSSTQFFSLPFVITLASAMLGGAALLFVFFHIRHKRRLEKASREKELASMELRSVRSQLNPHFIFNALAGIQHLVNNGDTKAANHYLSKFARITRNVLDENRNEIISLADEIRFLEDYLQMEQFRFGFNYAINVDQSIDRSTTELPAMLLQPYIENAVKHGVSALKEGGNIDVSFQKKEDNMVIEVRDNGRGHDSSNPTNGLGWKLCEDRIELLNKLHKDVSISLQKKSDHNGTLITIMLNKWLAYAGNNN